MFHICESPAACLRQVASEVSAIQEEQQRHLKRLLQWEKRWARKQRLRLREHFEVLRQHRQALRRSHEQLRLRLQLHEESQQQQHEQRQQERQPEQHLVHEQYQGMLRRRERKKKAQTSEGPDYAGP